MKKILLILLFMYSLAFAKIEVIKDDFKGTEYYQTEAVTLSTMKIGSGSWGQVRFRTANGDTNIIAMECKLNLKTKYLHLELILLIWVVLINLYYSNLF